MARLLVFRGETLEREFDLYRLPFKLGRAVTNDAVLEDPSKSVSREHAEIRVENGRYVLADKQSENGIWSAGQRRTSVVFEPDTVASIGPFRLKIEGAPPTGVYDPTIAANIDTVLAGLGTSGSQPAAPPASSPASTGVTGTGRHAATGTAVPAAPPEPARTAPPPPPAPSRPAPPPPAKARTKSPAAKSNGNQMLLIGGGAALLLLLGIGLIFLSRRQEVTPAVDPLAQVGNYIAAANAQIAQKACAEALSQNIGPALALDPTNGELLTLRQQAENCVTELAANAAAPIETAISNTLASAREAIAANQCDAALTNYINFVLATYPDNQEALALKEQALACATAPAPAAPAAQQGPRRPQLAVRVPPQQGGLEPLAGELDADYKTRMAAMHSRYDDAVAAAARGVSRAVITQLETIARETPPQYLELAAKLNDARRAFRDSAQVLFNEAKTLAERQQWNDALRKLADAVAIDPSLPVEAERTKIQNAKFEAGQAACRRGRQLATYAQPGATAEYRRVLDLLPAEDPCYVEAKRMLGER